MKISHTSIAEVKILEPQIFSDKRGYFFEAWRESFFRTSVSDQIFVQENQSFSTNNVLRGLHYQLPNPQGKLIHVTQGKIFDVALDIRKSSPTFGKYVGVELSAENKKMLWIPEGFAHGFLVLGPGAEVCYKCTAYYDPASEHTILWNDPQVNINWPLIDKQNPVVSDKDSCGTLFSEATFFD